MPAPRVIKEFWTKDERRCVLCFEDTLEIRLYEKGQLVAMWPCEKYERAFELSIVWRHHPPRWPPEG
jgi:hypothetical protein